MAFTQHKQIKINWVQWAILTEEPLNHIEAKSLYFYSIAQTLPTISFSEEVSSLLPLFTKSVTFSSSSLIPLSTLSMSFFILWQICSSPTHVSHPILT